MQQQAGTAELCLDVEAAALLPGRNEAQHVGVRPQPLVVPRLAQAPDPVAAITEPLDGTLDCILSPINKTLNLWRGSKPPRLQKGTGHYF